MPRTLAVLIAFGFCALLGDRRAHRLRLRQETLFALHDAVRRFMMAMAFEKKPLHKLAARPDYGPAQPLFTAFAAALGENLPTSLAWRRAMREAAACDAGLAALTEADRTLLQEFAAALGASDLRTQQQNAALLLARLSDCAKDARAEYGKKGRVYRAMGALCGAAVAILML